MTRPPGEPASRAGVARAIELSFFFALAGSVAFAVVFWRGAQIQLEAASGFVALGGMALGLGIWANAAMPGGNDEQERESLPSTGEQRRAFVADFEEGERILVRRRLVLALAGSSVVVGAVAALFPFRSLGPRPGRSLRTTAWSKGSRLVTASGQPLRPSDLSESSAVTVFPEGIATLPSGSAERASAQAVLIRFGDAAFHPRPGREHWTVDHCVAYSRVCTHAGCPVGLYEADAHKLVCPCHQSLFDVLDGARPEFGPASRALPQLPLSLDGEGYLIAQSDFREPVGPSYWNR